jgi:hypothetical protein
LFEAIEEFAPEAFEGLRNDVAMAAIDRFGPIVTGTVIMGRWADGLERWQRIYHLHRWKSAHHSRSFDSVAQMVLLGLETTSGLGEHAWVKWKGATGIALSPGVTAYSEWRLLEATDAELASKLTLPPPALKTWNPVLGSWSAWRKAVDRKLREYRQAVEDAFRDVGAESRSVKRKARSHFEWLVRYQVREEDFGPIAEAIDAKQNPTKGDTEARVRKAVQATAGLIGLRLRRGPGRPPSSQHSSS